MKRMKNRGDVGLDLDVLKMSLAALFCTFWRLERRYLRQPAKVSCSNLVSKEQMHAAVLFACVTYSER